MKITNPLLKMDMPDMDVIKANGYYYMVSTTMFFMPGGPILRSKDLKNWEIVSYIFDIIADNDIYNLKDGKNAYGAGQWATSLAYNDGRFYAAFVCNDLKKTFIYSTDDIEKSFWEQHTLDGIYHDMSFLFWENRAFLVYGNGDIYITELNDNLIGLKENGLNKLLFSTPGAEDGIMLRCEGCRAYVRNDYIYLCFIEWPKEGHGNFRRREICYRAKSLDGPFDRQIIFDDDMEDNNRGIAQGVLIEGYDNKWYSMLFQDHGGIGRIPYLIPMKWENDWPVIGIEGKAPKSFEIDYPECYATPLAKSDTFNYSKDELPVQFQWNHNPINDAWSFTKRRGYLRLINTVITDSLMSARNTLTERTVMPKSAYTIEGDFSNLKNGDVAGISAFMGHYGLIGITKDAGKYYIFFKLFKGTEKRFDCSNIKGFNCKSFWLRIVFDFENQDKAYFYYSCDGKEFTAIDECLDMEFTLDVFVGYRLGIFSYPTKEIGGYVDFRNLILE